MTTTASTASTRTTPWTTTHGGESPEETPQVKDAEEEVDDFEYTYEEYRANYGDDNVDTESSTASVERNDDSNDETVERQESFDYTYEYVLPELRKGYSELLYGDDTENSDGYEPANSHEYYGGQYDDGAETEAEALEGDRTEESSYDEYESGDEYDDWITDAMAAPDSTTDVEEQPGAATLGAVISVAARSLDRLGGALCTLSRQLEGLK